MPFHLIHKVMPTLWKPWLKNQLLKWLSRWKCQSAEQAILESGDGASSHSLHFLCEHKNHLKQSILAPWKPVSFFSWFLKGATANWAINSNSLDLPFKFLIVLSPRHGFMALLQSGVCCWDAPFQPSHTMTNKDLNVLQSPNTVFSPKINKI